MPMIETESCTPPPLFGTFCTFDKLQPSDSHAESQLILSSIGALDRKLNAAASLQIACEFLWGIRDRSITHVGIYKAMFEKLLLWCFYFRRKSLLDLTDLDLIDFQSFYMSPPNNWVARRTFSRFNATSGCVCFNKAWRPFTSPHNMNGRERTLSNGLNRIIREVLPNATLRALVPRNEFPAANDLNLCGDDIANIIEKYLDYLFGLRSARGAHEISLFLFACASYLQTDVPGFHKLRPHLYLNDIAPLPGGGFSWKIDTPYGQIIHTIPRSFGRYYERYCDAVGFNIKESYPSNMLAFQRTTVDSEVTGLTITRWFKMIPAHPEISLTPSELLNLLVRKSNSSVEKAACSAKNRSQAYRIYNRKRLGDFHTRLDGLKINSTTQVESLLLSDKGMAFPLLYLTENNGVVFLRFNYLGVRKLLIFLDDALISEHVDSLRVFLLYVYNHVNGGVLNRQARAYETLLLWTFLVRRKPVRLLNEADAFEFFEFCCAPPASWVTTQKFRILRDCDPAFPEYHPHWRPFRSSRGRPRARAAVIVTYCSQVQAWAIKCGLQNLNVFFKPMLRLWNGYK